MVASHNDRILRGMLQRTLEEIRTQEDHVAKLADEIGCEPHEVRASDGSYMLAGLLNSKALVLNGLAIMQGK